MPDWFEAWLRNLSPGQQDDLWLYLDGNPRAIYDVMEVVDNHGRRDGLVLFATEAEDE